MKRSVCFVSPAAYPVLANANFQSCGGAEVQQVLLAKALRDKGYKITFIVQDYGQKKQEFVDGMQVISGPFHYLGGSNLYFPVDAVRLVYLLKHVKADIYVLKDPPVLLFAMGCYRRFFGGKLVQIIAHEDNCKKINNHPSQLLYRLGIRYVDCTVFQAEYQQQIGGENLGLQGCVIRNIAPDKNGSLSPRQNRDIDVLWVGTAVKRKQPHLFLDIAEQMSDVQFTMIIAPDKDKPLNQSIQERGSSIANVNYLGFVKYSEIAKYYESAKIFVSTSNAEGFPNVFLQAWQSGVPVVSLLVDPDGVIQKNNLGRVSGTTEQFCKDIRYLLANESERLKMAENGVQYVQDNHGQDLIVHQYMDIFDRLLKPN